MINGHGENRFGALGTAESTSTGIAGIGTVLAAVAGGLVFGIPGVLVGATLVGAWLVASPIFVLALGQLLFAALLPADAPVATVAVVEGPLLVLFTGSVTDPQVPLRTALLGVGTVVALAALVFIGVNTLDALWQAGALLAVTVAFIGYGLHRYTVVALEATHEF